MSPLSCAADPEALAAAAYGLAFRITGDETRAVESLEAAMERRRPSSTLPAAFLNRVRTEARSRRSSVPDPETAPRPQRLAFLPVGEWAVVERIVLRGMSVTETAEALELDRRDVLLRLQRGLAAAGSALLGKREARDEPDAAGLRRLGRDLAACGVDDPARDR
jgi:hypothetical protein